MMDNVMRVLTVALGCLTISGPAVAKAAMVTLGLSDSVTVARDGTLTDPMTSDAASGVPTDLFIRERGNGDEEQARVFMKFDLSSVVGDVTSATLGLTVADRAANASESAINIARVTTAWNTGGANYPLFSQASADSVNTGIDDDAAIGTALSVDVTSFVQGWTDGTNANNGFVMLFTGNEFLMQAYGDGVNVAEDGTTVYPAPTLTVVFTTPPTAPEPSSFVLASLGLVGLSMRRRRCKRRQ